MRSLFADALSPLTQVAQGEDDLHPRSVSVLENESLSSLSFPLTTNPLSHPGIFFDVNPSKRSVPFPRPLCQMLLSPVTDFIPQPTRRDLFASPCHHYVRLSFGPPMDQLEIGMDAIERLVQRARSGKAKDGG